MTTLDQMREKYQQGVASAKHVLLIGQTKAGKSRYVAEAAKAGFEVLYIDKDNGLGTLMESLKDSPEAMKRIHYFSPPDIATFVESILVEGVYRWNITQNTGFSSGTAKPEDEIVEFFGSRFPRNMILSIDSWTSLSDDVIRKQASRKKVDLSDVDRYSREIYGGVGFRLTRIAGILQHAPIHTIVQAHPDVFEVKEKPEGRVGSIDEKDMIIREVVDIPMSGSRPHGFSMGKFFNEIGWLSIDGFGKRILDFTVRPKRIGGGTIPTKGDVMESHGFAKLFFPNGVPPVEPNPGINYMTAAEWIERRDAGKPAAKGNTIPATPPAGQQMKTPVTLGGLKKG